MAGQAVPFGVTGYAALQVLPGRLAVAQEKRLLGIVVSCVESPSGGEPGTHMTVCTKLARIMTVAAAGLSGICRGWMTGEEAGRMVAGGRIRSVGSMTVEALRTDMATAAGLRPRVRGGTMPIRKIGTVRSRPGPADHGTLSPAGSRGRQGQRGGGLADVAGQTALLRVAARARHGRLTGSSTVPPQEPRVRVAGRRLQFRPSSPGSGDPVRAPELMPPPARSRGIGYRSPARGRWRTRQTPS